MSACLLSASTLLWHCPLFALPLLMLVGDLCMLHCYMLSYILFYFDLQHATFHLFCLPLYLGLGGCTSSCYRLSHSCIPHMSACNIQLGTAVPLLAQITLSHCSAAQPASLAIMLPVRLTRQVTSPDTHDKCLVLNYCDCTGARALCCCRHSNTAGVQQH